MSSEAPERKGMWLKPSLDAERLRDIWQYALTVDGYAYAQERWKAECGDLANERLEAFGKTGVWAGSFEELRCCLFFEQRRYHHFGWDPSGKECVAIKLLYWTIVNKWYQETGGD